jgi:hypothetical protein
MPYSSVLKSQCVFPKRSDGQRSDVALGLTVHKGLGVGIIQFVKETLYAEGARRDAAADESGKETSTFRTHASGQLTSAHKKYGEY